MHLNLGHFPLHPMQFGFRAHHSMEARPDFTKLDVFLGQHILLTLEQHFNPKM